MSEDPTSADSVDCRPNRNTPGEGLGLHRPSQHHRKGRRPRPDLEKEPGLRHEVRDAGLQQAGTHDGPAKGVPRTDPNDGDGLR